MDKLLFSLILIVSALATGAVIRQLVERGIITLFRPLDDVRRLLQKIGLLFFMPVSFLIAVWSVHLADLRIALLPVFGVAALVTGGILGLLLARLTQATPKETGVLFCCTSFTNIGSIGALVCYMFLGEPGFALVPLYKMFEEIVYYTIGFPVARYYSGLAADEEKPLLQKIVGVLRDPFVATILSAFFLGALLNLGGISRPPLFESINSFFIPAGTFILIVSIGLGMRFSRLGKHLPRAIYVTLSKSLLIPVFITFLAWLAGLGSIDSGLPLMVIFILSSMPAAFNSLVAASLYDLDLDLANSCWLISTLSLVVVLPWLLWATGVLSSL